MECHSLVFESYADDMDHQHFLSMPPAIRSMTVSTPRWACENSTQDLRPRRISISSNSCVICALYVFPPIWTDQYLLIWFYYNLLSVPHISYYSSIIGRVVSNIIIEHCLIDMIQIFSIALYSLIMWNSSFYVFYFIYTYNIGYYL